MPKQVQDLYHSHQSRAKKLCRNEMPCIRANATNELGD